MTIASTRQLQRLLVSLAMPFLGTAILVESISRKLANEFPDASNSLTAWFLHRLGFTLPFSVMLATIGLVLLTAGRRGSTLSELVDDNIDYVRLFYASAAGSVAGWVCGILFSLVRQDPTDYWWIATVLIGAVLFITIAPQVVLWVTHQLIQGYNSRLFGLKKPVWILHVAGLFVFATGIRQIGG